MVVARGAQLNLALHPAIRDGTVKLIEDRRAFKPGAKLQMHAVGTQAAGHRSLKLGRALTAGDCAALLLQGQPMRPRTMQEGDLDIPGAGDVDLWHNRRRLRNDRCRQRGGDGTPDLIRLTRLQAERIDLDRVGRGRHVVQHHPRLTVQHAQAQRLAVQRILRVVPTHHQPRHLHHALRRDDFRADARHRQAAGNGRDVIVPALQLNRRVAMLEPHFQRGEDADHVFLGHFHAARETLMRRGIAPCGPDQVFPTQQQTAGLWTTQELAATVDHQVGAAHQVRAGLFDVLRRRVHQYRNAAGLGPRNEILQLHLGVRILVAQDQDHCHRFLQRRIKVGDRADLDDMRADHADRLIIGEPLVLHHDHAVHPAIGEWQAQDLRRIVAGDTGGGGECQRGRAAAGHHAQLGTG